MGHEIAMPSNRSTAP